MMMKMTRQDLVKQVLDQNKDLDEASARFNKNLRKLYADYVARFKAFAQSPESFGRSQIVEVSRLLQVSRDLNVILAEAGVEKLVEDYLDQFPKLTKSTLKYFEDVGIKKELPQVSREAIDSYITFTEIKLREKLSDELVRPLSDGLFQASFGTRSRSTIVSDLLDKTDYLKPSQVEVLVDSTFANYQRAVTVETAANTDLSIFVYVGPDDDITSDQCSFLLNIDDHGLKGALYEKEISANLHPKLRGNPLFEGGHPRCRHKYMPISLEFAQSMGFEK